MNPQLNRILVRQAHAIISDLLSKGVNVISDSQHVNPRFCVDEVQIAVRHKVHVETFTVNLPDLTVGASVLSAEMIASGTAT